MRLVEQSIDNNNHAVLLAKVRYLQSVLPTPIVGTAGVVLMFFFVVESAQREAEMLVWLSLGLITSIWRGILLFRYKAIFHTNQPLDFLYSYLTQTTLTAAIAGMTFGWGWIFFYEHLSPEIQMGFLFTNIVMLFGGLYAYSPHLRAYGAFSLFSLGPALWQLQQQSGSLWLAQTVGIGLVALVSQMFAFRWAQNFRHNVLLQEKNAALLAELTEKKELAEKATRAKSRFLASVSHDLRQPLHAINLYLAVLSRTFEHKNMQASRPPTNFEFVSSSVNHLQESATQLTRMFEALIDISKLDAGTTQARLSPIKIATMLEHLTQEFQQLNAQSGLIFDQKITPQIKMIEVFADPIMLERVLRNLLSNATNHTSSGGVRLRVKIVNRHEKNKLEFRVIDTGPGIQQAERAKIFEEFYQSEVNRQTLSSTTNSVKNLGLGLAISSRLAELLMTRIRLHSFLGKGSVFAFDLPMQFSSSEQNKPSIKSKENDAVMTSGLNGACIAVIDDDSQILRATSQLLESYGAMVLTAHDSQGILNAINKGGKKPDIFLVDHRLEKESGLELIQRIQRKYSPTKPCILITGDTSADQVEKFHQAKLRVLYKPLTDFALIEMICTELKTHS